MVNKGSNYAKNLLKEHNLKDLTEFLLEDFVLGRGAYINEKTIDGAEGRISFSGNDAIVTINSNIQHQGKKRFVLAHEFGHFEMHKNKFATHFDNEKSLSDWYKNIDHEQEANDFAKELLMPECTFKPLAQGKFSMTQIEELAHKFQTSKTATLLRYRDLGSYPIALIFIDNGVVKWTQYSQDFVLQFIPNNSNLPINTVAGDVFYRKNNIPKDPELVEAIDWFPQDFNIERYKNWKFKEQCFSVSETGILSCLWGY